MSNNVAESYNAVVCKYVGGKRVNYSQRFGYNLRCNMAAISYNTRRGALENIYKRLCNNSIGKYTSKHAKLTSDRVSKRKLCHVGKRQKIIQPADENYGLEEDIPDISPTSYSKRKDKFLDELQKTEEEIAEMEIRTAGQGRSQLWHEERAKRLTASNFGRICKKRESTNCANLIKQIIYKGFPATKAMQYGIDKEPIAKQQFENKYNLNVIPCGLFIDTDDCYLAASPDGLIGEDSLIEIKCPFSAQKYTPKEAIEKKIVKYCTIQNDEICLNRRHDYFYQIQGQLHISKRSMCYFVLWTPYGMEVEKISKDNNFWKTKMQNQLHTFYFQNMLPELVDPRHTRNLPIRNN